MECSKCHQNSIIFQPYSGQYLCERHFVAEIETKVKRVIRQHQWLKPGDHIGVLLSGNRDSGALLYFLNALTSKRRDIKISAFTTETGTGKDRNLLDAGQIADIARKNKFTGIAVGYTLEDFSRSVLANFLSGCPVWENHHTDQDHRLFRWIFPFMAVSAREIALYAHLYGVGCDPGPCITHKNSFHNDVMKLLSEYTDHHPATMYALLALGENLSKTCGAGELYFLSPELKQGCSEDPLDGVSF
jgi:tRNA(Ile)-lysidine synthase TilS/MesJ